MVGQAFAAGLDLAAGLKIYRAMPGTPANND